MNGSGYVFEADHCGERHEFEIGQTVGVMLTGPGAELPSGTSGVPRYGPEDTQLQAATVVGYTVAPDRPVLYAVRLDSGLTVGGVEPGRMIAM